MSETKRKVILNFIWLGPAPLPEWAQKNILGWGNLHPDWTMALWRDHNLPPMSNIKLFNAAPNFGEKSDILRYEILKSGGTAKRFDFNLYMDVDVVPVKPLYELVDGCDFLLTLAKSQELNDGMYVQNAVIGSIPRHPFMCSAVGLLSPHVIDMEMNPEKFNGTGTVYRTGPQFLQRVITWHCGKGWKPLHYPLAIPTDFRIARSVVRVLPYEYFYPTQYQCLTEEYFKHPENFPTTYGVHTCAGSWAPDESPVIYADS